MKIFKLIANCCLVFLALIGACISLAYAYVYFKDNDFTTGTNYIDDQVPVDLVEKAEDLTDEEIQYYEDRWLFNVNYYSNDKNNGLEVQEMQLNHFTDISLNTSACRSTGMQYIGDFETYLVEFETREEADDYVWEDFYYYDTTNMISWSGGKIATQLNRNAKLIIKIDNKPYMIQLTGEEREWHYKSKTLLGKILKLDSYTDTLYSYKTVFYDVMNAVESNSAGYGEYYITVNLSEYFTVYEYDFDKKDWNEDNISDEIFTYAVLKFNYNENGMLNSEQSIFGQIECNPSYNLKEEIDTTYWQERIIYTLDEDNFSYRYSDVYKGYFLSLDMDTKKLFAEMPRAKVNININLQSQYFIDKGINIVGIDYNGFENFEIDTLTIVGEPQTIHVLDKALYNTKLQTLKYSNGIILDFAENSINNEYVEVVL